MKRSILMSEGDTVATALENLKAGDVTSVVLPSQEISKEIIIRQAVPFGHKLAVRTIARWGAVIKYGEVIGQASQNIDPGDYVHIHNVTSNRVRLAEVWYRK